MDTKISYTSANFAFGMMWGGKEKIHLSVLNKDAVELAVNIAYRDMIQHNVKGLGLNFKCSNKEQKEHKKNILKLKTKKINELKQDFAEQVALVFKNRNFSHETLCEYFVVSFKGVIGELNKSIISFGLPDEIIDDNQITYGLAQKIVNMTFKYLYLFDDKDDYVDIFQKCHMPLDSYILNYLRTNDDWNIGVISANHKWSKLEPDEYKKIADAIQNKCKEKDGDLQYPLFAEFYIWPKALEQATKKQS